MFWLFAVFILSCGLTHVVGIWNLYNNDYAAEATIKAITAAANVPTAILLWPLLPSMLAIPSPSMLQRKNEELGEALADRDRLLEELRTVAAQRERNEAALVQANKMEAAGQLTGGIAMTSTICGRPFRAIPSSSPARPSNRTRSRAGRPMRATLPSAAPSLPASC